MNNTNTELDALRAEVARLTAEVAAATTRADRQAVYIDQLLEIFDAVDTQNAQRAAAARRVAEFCRKGWRVVGHNRRRTADHPPTGGITFTIRQVWSKEQS